jgi:hypothetical protein
MMVAASVAGVGCAPRRNLRRRLPDRPALLALVTHARADAADGAPWIWYLLNVGTSAAVLAFGLPLQIAWAALIPILYAIARLTQLGGAPRTSSMSCAMRCSPRSSRRW